MSCRAGNILRKVTKRLTKSTVVKSPIIKFGASGEMLCNLCTVFTIVFDAFSAFAVGWIYTSVTNIYSLCK